MGTHMHNRFTTPFIVLSLLSIGAVGAQTNPEILDATRSNVAKWMATQELIFKERKDWQEQKDVLQVRIAAAEKEVAAVEAKLGQSREALGRLRSEEAEGRTAKQKLVDSADWLSSSVTRLESDVRRLHPVLPGPVQEKVAPLFRRIPEDPQATRVAVAERFQNVVGILNEIQKSNGDISLFTEIRPLSDGKPSEVKTVYVGLGQAYFLSAGGEAGVGRPSASGWQWQAHNDLAESIAQVIEILENKGKPRFVSLPVTIE